MACGALCLTSLVGLNASAASSAAAAPLEAPVAASGAQAAAPKAAALDALWQQLEKTPFIREGADDAHAKGMYYAFFDPNCIYCHLAWKLSQPYLKQGLQVRWVPVAFVMPDSAAKVAWIMTSPDPSAALTHGEAGWKQGVADGGGAFMKGPVTAEMTAQIKANEKLFTEFGFTGTPSFVYKDPLGVVRTLPGISSQHMITSMTGLAFIPTTDPDLARIPE